MASTQPPASQKLSAIVAAGENGIEERLAAALHDAGGPLIEPISGDDAHLLVTFAWIGSPGIQSVRLHTSLSAEKQLLNRVGNSNAWAKSFVVGNGVRTAYQFFEDDPELEPTAETRASLAEFTRFMERSTAGLRADPFNNDLIPPYHFAPGLARERYQSVLSMPNARPQPWLAERPGVARGQTEAVPFTSAILGNERTLHVYTPPGFSASGPPLPLTILLDGRSFRWIAGAATTLDNLIARAALPPMVVVMADNPTVLSRLTEYECNDDFANMLATELVPWIRQRYGVTADRSRTIIGGVSYGGLGSAHAALRHPHVFGNVLSCSGSYWWGPSVRDAEWLTRQYAQGPAAATRFYLDAGTLESLADAPLAGATMIAVSRHMRDVLEAKGMEVTFDVFESGHEYVQWRASLADGLTWLTRDW